MASLAYLTPQLDRVLSSADTYDMDVPVVSALCDLLGALNTPLPHARAFRPYDIIAALGKQNQGRHNSLFSSREHQDAQELFQLLSESVANESSAVAKEIRRDRGLGRLTPQDHQESRDLNRSVFDGLTANRRSCMRCGYTEAVMHFPFNNMQLAVPTMKNVCMLEDCLEEYTRIELLQDCVCRRCSLEATSLRLEQDAEQLKKAAQATPDPSSSRKKRAREARKLAAKVKELLQTGRVEEDIKGVTLDRIISPATKQSMIARPPPVLALHLNRSVHTAYGATKNNCHVSFSEILDLTPFTTSGQLSTAPSLPISSPPPVAARTLTPTPGTYIPRTLYRLAAVVCHYGVHQGGHYVCFRRKPRGHGKLSLPQLACLYGCECARCTMFGGPVRDDDAPPPGPGRGWLHISDDKVEEVGFSQVRQQGVGAFMLFYERVYVPRTLLGPPLPPPAATSDVDSRASQETVMPQEREREREDGHHERVGSRSRDERERSVDPRVVRRTSASGSHSTGSTVTARPSAPPMERSTSAQSQASTTTTASAATAKTTLSTATAPAAPAQPHSPSHHHRPSHINLPPRDRNLEDAQRSPRSPQPPPSPSKQARLRKTKRPMDVGREPASLRA
ncbi:cysteine proteinase [Epithele typhae]|uniref:cysteine proteinase n=1 Tax=Epithele typhae TaxID=378194 RepID=UPI002008A4DB|nr:cysteine proteinase [Epithele typhae]KAH9927081.1 cysteine proteinase [Epithele typhae]